MVCVPESSDVVSRAVGLASQAGMFEVLSFLNWTVRPMLCHIKHLQGVYEI